MYPYQSPLGKMYQTPKNPEEIKEKCRKAVENDGLLLWHYKDCKDDWERQFFKNKAKELYSE